jgi:two-component system cell cycle sensor histidine kinase/response regulator CckA
VYSELGHGTTFRIYLPRSEALTLSSKSSPGLNVTPGGTETILLVEDDDGVRAITRHALQGCGYEVLLASGGDEALRLAANHDGPLHLLVTDVVMPGMGGRKVAEQLVSLKPTIKTLFLSGYTDDAVVRHGVLEAEVAFLQKPFTLSALAQKVREVLDGPNQSISRATRL